ncbi:hypothetical protein LJB83_02715, partial [Clostridia bacterium OttesenSCG-928-F22]|nr:hypothetical protein [Clostridia bacterium OttesenSCG-928-F22]
LMLCLLLKIHSRSISGHRPPVCTSLDVSPNKCCMLNQKRFWYVINMTIFFDSAINTLTILCMHQYAVPFFPVKNSIRQITQTIGFALCYHV